MEQQKKQQSIHFPEELEDAIREFAYLNGKMSFTSAVRFLVALGLRQAKK